ncbi:hypothetical protein [Streptomyces eurythermus]|uniref:hypothetical protein n=1 Tax=Streptomyces eurythermus TaxID=42237 RepID=UPI0033D351D3
MRLIISPDAAELGLSHARAWLVEAETPLLDGSGIAPDDALRLASADAHPVPAGYAELLAALGHPGTVPAGERLRELVRTRGWRSIGAVVDAINVATLRHGGGIGLHRLDHAELTADCVVTRARGTERIVPAFSTRSRPVPGGDLVYGLREDEPFAWLGRRDCDAADRQLTETSRLVLLVVLGCPGQDGSHTEAIGATISDLLRSLRPDAGLTALATVSGEAS